MADVNNQSSKPYGTAIYMQDLGGVFIEGSNQEVPADWRGVAALNVAAGGYAYVVKSGELVVSNQRLDAASFDEAVEMAQAQGLDVGQSRFVAQMPSVQASVPASSNFLDAEESLWKRLREGVVPVEEFKAGFESWVSNKDAIVALLSLKKKDDLLKMLDSMMSSRYRSEKKADVADAVWREGMSTYVLARSYSYGMGKDSQVNGVRAMVERTDAAQLAEYAERVRSWSEEAKARVSKTLEALKDPQTREDYNIWMRAKMEEDKLSFKEARLSLTPQQRAHYDDLVASETRSTRVTAKDEERTTVRVAGQVVQGEIIATKHTRKGHDLFVVQLAERVSTEDYNTLVSGAKRMGGYYSSFRGSGAVPGFQFTAREQADAFVALAQGDNTAAKEVAQANRDAFQDDRSQTAVERLTEMADRLEGLANDSLGVDRKQNTHKRAEQAARAERAANQDKALAVTMRNIAQAIDGGSAKYLDRVRQKVQVSMLQGYVVAARYEEMRAKNLNYEKYKDEPPTVETADYAEFPLFTAYRSNLASLARELLTVDGTKLIGQRLLKAADDVSAAYLKFAKENYLQVATFATKGGERPQFGTRDAAEESISRSGYKGRAIAYQVKRGQHTVILSPSEAVERGVWKGDGDARLSLTPEFGAELVEKIGKAARRGSKVSVPWQLETAYDRRKALARMGIETPAEFRACLREFIGLKAHTPEPDKVKALERSMIGRRNDGLDFFPTAEANADEMVASANIEPGMSVYEPHGGWGHIAERIRAAGVEPDVGELSFERRELLEAKGYRLVSGDFLDVTPDTFFTFGDTFRAQDGTEGRMQPGAGLAADEVLLVRADGTAMVYERDDLVAVAKNLDSGYDRILMNPPFSDGRDIQHLMHAYSLLNPRGRVVSLLGESAFTNSNSRATAFREWLDSVGASVEKLPEGSFMDPSLPVNTGANARMVVIDRPDYGLELAPVRVVSNELTQMPSAEPVIEPLPEADLAREPQVTVDQQREENATNAADVVTDLDASTSQMAIADSQISVSESITNTVPEHQLQHGTGSYSEQRNALGIWIGLLPYWQQMFEETKKSVITSTPQDQRLAWTRMELVNAFEDLLEAAGVSTYEDGSLAYLGADLSLYDFIAAKEVVAEFSEAELGTLKDYYATQEYLSPRFSLIKGSCREEIDRRKNVAQLTALQEAGFEVEDLTSSGYVTSTPEVQRDVAALLGVDQDLIVEPTQGDIDGSTRNPITTGGEDSSPDTGQSSAQVGDAGTPPSVDAGNQGSVEPIQSVQPADTTVERDVVGEESLQAAQALLDEAQALAYPMPYLAECLADGIDPADPLQVLLLESLIQESRDYNDLMLAYAGDFAGLEFKHKDSAEPSTLYAFVLPDASRPEAWRVTYFDANGFSHHAGYPSQEQAQQALVREGYTTQAPGALDRLSQTQEWAIGTATSDLIIQLNSGAITHTQFLVKHKELFEDYAVTKKQSSVGAPPEVQAVPSADIDGVSYPLTTYKTNGGKILSGIWVPTREIALSVTESTFQKRPFGWFIRERDFPEGALRRASPLEQAIPDETAAIVVTPEAELAQDVPVAVVDSPVVGGSDVVPVVQISEAVQTSSPSQEESDEQDGARSATEDQIPSVESQGMVSTDVAQPVVEAKMQGAIDGTQDAGEELNYNKRNRIRAGLKWNDLQDLDPALRVSQTTKDKVYPKPDYPALVGDGMPALIAHIVKQCYDSVSVKPEVRGAPSDEDLQLYIRSVNRYMDGVMQWANDPVLIKQWVGAMARRTGTVLDAIRGVQIGLSSLIEQPDKSLLEVVYGVEWRDHIQEIRMIGTNKPLSALTPHTNELRRAQKDIEKGWPNKVEAWQKQGYRILLGDDMSTRCYKSGFRLREGEKPWVSVSLEVMDRGRRIGLLDKRFDVESEDHPVVLAYMASMLSEYKGKHLVLNRRNSLVGIFESHALALERAREATQRSKNDKTIDDKGISVEMAQRDGPVWREGDRDVTTDELVEVFGFKGVNFGNWMKGAGNQAERQLHINHLYDAFMDLSDLLQVPPRSMSLGGILGIAVGAQGNGQYSAHFVPGENEINITRTTGAGLVAHEWAHALDHYFARLVGKEREAEPYLTAHMQGGALQKVPKRVGNKWITVEANRYGDGLRPEVIGAFKDVVTVMSKRPMTEQELLDKDATSLERDRKRVESWIGALAKEYKNRGMDEEAVASLDKLFERVRAGDIGEGYVGSFSPVIEEIRKEFKVRTGNVPSLENVKGLQACAQYLRHVLTKGKEPKTSEERLTTSTDFAKHAMELDEEKGGKPYFATTLEKFARSFDAFVSDAVESKGCMNSYLSLTGRQDRSVPLGQDRVMINAAINKLITLIQNHELVFDETLPVQQVDVSADAKDKPALQKAPTSHEASSLGM